MGPRAIILLASVVFLGALFVCGLVVVAVSAIRKRKQALALGALLCMLSACLILLISLYAGVLGVRRALAAARTFQEQSSRDINGFFDNGPDAKFARVTGLDWPASGRVLADYDDDWLFDWESYVVFEAGHEDLETWLSNPPPFGAETWSPGPVPHDVLRCCSGSTWQDLGAEELATSDAVWYAAEETSGNSIPYHGGLLMIIDPESNRVWVAAWDH